MSNLSSVHVFKNICIVNKPDEILCGDTKLGNSEHVTAVWILTLCHISPRAWIDLILTLCHISPRAWIQVNIYVFQDLCWYFLVDFLVVECLIMGRVSV